VKHQKEKIKKRNRMSSVVKTSLLVGAVVGFATADAAQLKASNTISSTNENGNGNGRRRRLSVDNLRLPNGEDFKAMRAAGGRFTSRVGESFRGLGEKIQRGRSPVRRAKKLDEGKRTPSPSLAQRMS
jgi:hypothetical protein